MPLDRRLKSDGSFFALLQLLNRKAMERDPARLGDLARSSQPIRGVLHMVTS